MRVIRVGFAGGFEEIFGVPEGYELPTAMDAWLELPTVPPAHAVIRLHLDEIAWFSVYDEITILG